MSFEESLNKLSNSALELKQTLDKMSDTFKLITDTLTNSKCCFPIETLVHQDDEFDYWVSWEKQNNKTFRLVGSIDQFDKETNELIHTYSKLIDEHKVKERIIFYNNIQVFLDQALLYLQSEYGDLVKSIK